MIGAFKRPIILFVGLGFPKLLNNPMDALQALDELPNSYRDAAYSAAVKSCRAAIAGDVEADTVRGIVEAYAKARGLLADVRVAPAAMKAKQDLLKVH